LLGLEVWARLRPPPHTQVAGPLRQRERTMQGSRSPGGLQRFVSVFSAVRHLFVPPHSRRIALATHLHRLKAMAGWKSAAGVVA
jgi:putative transposase